jgi:hypothetical protein
MNEMMPAPEVVARLAGFFRRNGYVRRLDPVRRVVDGQLYKKGAEVRLVAESAAELFEIRRLLGAAGFKVARPFAKDRQWRQPVYGVAAVARFLALIGEPRPAESQVRRREATRD